MSRFLRSLQPGIWSAFLLLRRFVWVHASAQRGCGPPVCLSACLSATPGGHHVGTDGDPFPSWPWMRRAARPCPPALRELPEKSAAPCPSDQLGPVYCSPGSLRSLLATFVCLACLFHDSSTLDRISNLDDKFFR